MNININELFFLSNCSEFSQIHVMQCIYVRILS